MNHQSVWMIGRQDLKPCFALLQLAEADTITDNALHMLLAQHSSFRKTNTPTLGWLHHYC